MPPHGPAPRPSGRAPWRRSWRVAALHDVPFSLAIRNALQHHVSRIEGLAPARPIAHSIIGVGTGKAVGGIELRQWDLLAETMRNGHGARGKLDTESPPGWPGGTIWALVQQRLTI